MILYSFISSANSMYDKLQEMKLLFLLITVCFISGFSIAQSRFKIDHRTCSYYGDSINEDIYSFSSTKEAVDIVDQIVKSVGLEQNFEIMAANVPNAAAVIYESKRYILYSQVFISKIERNTSSKWSSISILAHEIGHHLNGHTLDSIGSRPDKELEADKFSGFVCFKLGATLEQAQEAMKLIASESGSSTHPPKSARLEAITIGWTQAKEEGGKTNSPESSPKEEKQEKPKLEPKPIEEESNGIGDLCISNTRSNRDVFGNMTLTLYRDNRLLRTINIDNGGQNCFYNLKYGVYRISYKTDLYKARTREIKIDKKETTISLSNY